MKKVLYTATVVKTHINHFHIPYLKLLKDKGYEVHVAAKNDYEGECVIPYCDKYFDIEFARNPFSKKNFYAYKKLKSLLLQGQYEIIHCHTPVASVVTRLAARGCRKKGTKVLYTAHGFHFYKGAPLINWLIYYPVELLCSKWTDILITINKEDYIRAKKMFAKKIEFISGIGFDAEKYKNIDVNRDEERRGLGVPKDAFLLCSVGELNKNKNHEAIIKAMEIVADENVYYIIAGQGDDREYLENVIKKSSVSDKVKILGYRKDVPQLYAVSDVCCFPSIREGLGLAALEGMAAGLPLLCADNRGTKTYAIEGVNAIVCKYNDYEGFARGIELLKNNPYICKIYGEEAKKKAIKFSVEASIKKMKGIYSNI